MLQDPAQEHLGLRDLGAAKKLRRRPILQDFAAVDEDHAIARALCLRPEILLLDEVTSALDPERVSEVLDTIRLLAEGRITMLIVSHEMSFVRDVSHRVAVMADGKVQEIGPPGQIFEAPTIGRRRDFVGKILRRPAGTA